MNFNAIVGNPPYMTMDGGANSSAQPIYQRFVYTVTNMTEYVGSLIIPARWYSGGKEHELKGFRDFMLHSKHLSLLHDYVNPTIAFPRLYIRGGICYFLWDRTYNNTTSLTQIVCHRANGSTVAIRRSMAIEDISIFIREWEAVSILEKVKEGYKFDNIGNHFSPRCPFGFRGYFRKDKRFQINSDGLTEPVVCIAKGYTKGFVDRKYITAHREWIDVWKVITPRANNIGIESSDDNFNVCIASPGTICTESYQVIGMDLGLDLESAQNLMSYLQTRFSRLLHSLAKASQDVSAKTMRFIPMQNFTSTSDIDWSKPIFEIDRQLYKKYNLTENEIEFIKTMIKPMAGEDESNNL